MERTSRWKENMDPAQTWTELSRHKKIEIISRHWENMKRINQQHGNNPTRTWRKLSRHKEHGENPTKIQQTKREKREKPTDRRREPADIVGRLISRLRQNMKRTSRHKENMVRTQQAQEEHGESPSTAWR